MSSETWKPISGFEGIYEVSDSGRVRSLDRKDHRGQMRVGRVLRPGTSTAGYLQVALSRDGSRKVKLIHRLVLSAFHGDCPNGSECLHGDGDRKNASLNNLKWGSRLENCADRLRHGNTARGERVGPAKLTEDRARAIRSDTRTLMAIATDYNVHFSTVARVKRGTTWAHVGENECL